LKSEFTCSPHTASAVLSTLLQRMSAASSILALMTFTHQWTVSCQGVCMSVRLLFSSLVTLVRIFPSITPLIFELLNLYQLDLPQLWHQQLGLNEVIIRICIVNIMTLGLPNQCVNWHSCAVLRW
jgi:hypothetical protein